jgi:hypothetical protein
MVGDETYCKPCTADEFDWETFKCTGVGMAGGGVTFNGYCDYVIEPPLACPCDGALMGDADGYIPASDVFFGRGAIQLSWNYNFRAASEALTSDPNTFCENPDLVATTPEYAWGAGIFFWMENLKEETTCHIEALKNHDFGGTLNNINGGLECPAYHGGWHGEAVKMRLNRYCRATETLGLDSIMVMDGCRELNASLAECLGDDTCPACAQFADGIKPLPPSDHGDDESDNTPVTTKAAATTAAQTTAGATTTVTATTTDEATTTDAASTTAAQTTTDITTSAGTTASDSTSTTQSVSTVVAEATTESSTTRAAQTTDGVATTTPAAATTEVDDEIHSCPDGLKPVEGMKGCCLPEVAYLGDGACDPDAPYNTPECNFDGGDCCRETCNFDTNYGCANEASQGYGPFGYFCLNPDLDEYINPEECTVDDRTRLGDGRCDADYNTLECNWDGGDCCEETCDPDYAYFECGEAGFDCKEVGTATTLPPETSTSSTVEGSTTTTSMVYAPQDPYLQVTVSATEMATVFKNDPDTPHGGDTLQIQGTSFGPNAQDVLIRFVVPASESDPASATLRVYSLSDADSGGIFHLAPESSTWSDQTVTWNNAPDYTARLGNLNAVKANKWYEVDVTSAIEKLSRKRSPVTVRIRSRNPGIADYSSRKGGNPPELKISYPLDQEVTDAPLVNDIDDTNGAAGFADEYSPPKQDYTTSNIVNVAVKEMYVSVDAYANTDDGTHYYPVWEDNGGVLCTTGEPPSWATGPYLKKTKKQCCDSYFMLKKDECMNS